MDVESDLPTGPVGRGSGFPRGGLLTWSALVLVAAVLGTAVWAADRPRASDPTVGDVVRVGVGDGGSIPGYLRTSRAELAGLLATPPPDERHTETYALVVLTDYRTPDALIRVLADGSVAEVVARVPLPDTQTEIVRIPAARVPGDVIAGMRKVAERKDREARDYRQRGAGLSGSADQQLRRVYDSGARVAAAEATAYRSACACVYAVVLQATPAVLRRIAERPGVRAVDPAPEIKRLDRAVFLPPLPEQSDVVRPVGDTMNRPANGKSTAG